MGLGLGLGLGLRIGLGLGLGLGLGVRDVGVFLKSMLKSFSVSVYSVTVCDCTRFFNDRH